MKITQRGKFFLLFAYISILCFLGYLEGERDYGAWSTMLFTSLSLIQFMYWVVEDKRGNNG